MHWRFSIIDGDGDVANLITNNIRKLRFEHDEMSQQALADAIGVTRQTVFAIEKNRYSPSLESAFRIAEVFDVPLDDVFKFREGD